MRKVSNVLNIKKYISHSGYNPLATINIYRVVGEEKNTSPKTKLAIEI